MIRTRVFRLTIAVFVGIPGTVVFGSVSALFLVGGASATYAFVDRRLSGFLPMASLSDSLLSAMLGGAGILGLVGFWLWAFGGAAFRRARLVAALFLFLGLAAYVCGLWQFAAHTFGTLALGCIGVFAGVFAFVDTMRPNPSVNADAPVHGSTLANTGGDTPVTLIL